MPGEVSNPKALSQSKQAAEDKTVTSLKRDVFENMRSLWKHLHFYEMSATRARQWNAVGLDALQFALQIKARLFRHIQSLTESNPNVPIFENHVHSLRMSRQVKFTVS